MRHAAIARMVQLASDAYLSMPLAMLFPGRRRVGAIVLVCRNGVPMLTALTEHADG